MATYLTRVELETLRTMYANPFTRPREVGLLHLHIDRLITTLVQALVDLNTQAEQIHGMTTTFKAVAKIYGINNTLVVPIDLAQALDPRDQLVGMDSEVEVEGVTRPIKTLRYVPFPRPESPS